MNYLAGTAVQTFLLGGGTLASLAEKYAIKAVRHRSVPSLVLLKYNQVDSPFAEQIVRECRGIILDESDNWRCVSRSFDKFFNSEEGHAAQIDWTTARVQEKVDGSLCSLYHYGNEWHVATTGTPDASGDINGNGMTFRQLFFETLGGWTAPDKSLEGITFLFELTAPENRVVIPHQSRGLTVLGARHALAGGQIHAADAYEMLRPFFGDRVRVVKEFPLQTINDVVATFNEFSPLKQEGYVIVDAAFSRIKVKHPGYVAIHHAKDGISPRSLLDIARKGEVSEVAAVFPEIAAELEKVREKVDALAASITVDYDRLKHIAIQKDFAIEAVKTPHSAPLFAVRSGKVPSVRAWLATASTEPVMRMMGMKAEPLP